ncbi:MAG: hypothetical protein JST54_26650 [Deltaproteobacteria bacterium]|nr:hypothetical protein [Deltaproteobacteria bacterium]
MPWAANALDADLSNLESAATVRLAATMSLLSCGAADTAGEVIGRPELANIDFIPARRNDVVVGVLARKRAEEAPSQTVSEIMLPLHERMLASAGDPLLPVLERLDNEPSFKLVLSEGRIEGILTLSDLQKLPVRSVIFTRLTHLELLLREVLLAVLDPNDERWLAHFAQERQDLLKRWLKRARKRRNEVDLLEITSLADKRILVRARRVFGEDTDRFCERMEPIEVLRDPLAHAGGFAMDPEDARRVAKAIRELGELIGVARSALHQKRTT